MHVLSTSARLIASPFGSKVQQIPFFLSNVMFCKHVFFHDLLPCATFCNYFICHQHKLIISNL